MQDLTPVGLSKDGRKLVLVSSSGEEFAVPVDHRLRTALRGDNARLGQLEMKMESALRPRDIQTRIRSGDSPETVAAAAQTTVEAIMPYAGPVLAERAHVAQSAQGASVRRKSADGPTPHRTLATAAAAYFSGIGVRADDVEWDAWRNDDGRWTLVATFAAGNAPRQARFSFDQRGRYVVSDNDEAKILTGEKAPPAPKQAGGAPTRRLSAVPADDELPLGETDVDELGRELGDDAIALVREAPRGPVDEAADELNPDRGDADWIASTPDAAEDTDNAAEDITEDTAPVERPVQGPVDGAAPVDEPVTEAVTERVTEPGDDAPEETASAKPARKKGRAPVPSWDEIMFGGGKGE